MNLRADRRLQSIFLIGAFVMSALISKAWAREPSRRLSQYGYSSWDREDGLPQNSVRAITQSSDGYLWVGTEEGLVRFDAVRFVKVTLGSSDGRADGYINVLYRDEKPSGQVV